MAFKNLQEFREEYPQYKNMPDMELARNIHKKWYSDKPFREVAQNLGVKSQPREEVDRTTGLPNFAARTKLSFISKPEQREKFLKTIYDDVRRLPNDTLVYRHPQTKKLTTIDEEGWSVNDIADWMDIIPETILGTAGVGVTALAPIPGARMFGAGTGTALGHGVRKKIGGAITGDSYGRNIDKPLISDAIKLTLGQGQDKKYFRSLSKEEKKEYAIAGLTGAAGEGAGQVITKIATPFAKKILPVKKAAGEWFAKYGGKLTPGQMTETRILDFLENIAGSSILGGGRVTTFKASQSKIAGNIAKDMIERFGNGATPEQAGILVQKLIKDKSIAFKKAGGALFKNVDIATQGQRINVIPLKKEAVKQFKKLVTMMKVKGKKVELMPSMKNPSTIRILRDIINLPDEVPFGPLNRWRGNLMEIGFAPNDLIPGQAAGLAKHLSGTIDGLFKQAEKGLSGEGQAALKLANTFWKQGKTKFNSKLIKALANKDPGHITTTIFKPRADAAIRKVKGIVDPATWKKLRGTYTSKLLLEDSIKPGTDIISGTKLGNALRKLTKPTLNTIYTKAEQQELRHLATVLKSIQNKPPDVGGGMLVQLSQAGAIVEAFGAAGLGGTPFTKASAAILAGPATLSQIFTRDGGIKWLTKGLVTRKGTKEAIKLASRLTALVGEENLLQTK